jgi:hypothetical protein
MSVLSYTLPRNRTGDILLVTALPECRYAGVSDEYLWNVRMGYSDLMRVSLVQEGVAYREYLTPELNRANHKNEVRPFRSFQGH